MFFNPSTRSFTYIPELPNICTFHCAQSGPELNVVTAESPPPSPLIHAVAANARFVTKFIRSAIHGHAGPEDIVVTDADLGLLVTMGYILRWCANNHVGVKLVAHTHNHVPDDRYAVVQDTA